MARPTTGLQVADVKEQVWVALVCFDVVDDCGLRMTASALQEALAALAYELVAQKNVFPQDTPLLGLV